MAEGFFLLADKIKVLREREGLTQAELSRQLGLTRSSVNAWEMGLSVPQTQYIVELAKMFKVSTDFLLGMDDTATLNIKGLTEKEVFVLKELIDCFHSRN